MIFKKLMEKPSRKILRILIILGFMMCLIIIPIMQYFSGASGYPPNLFASQLSFNGEILKNYYAVTNIMLYRVSALLDYIFMTGYGIILFSSSVLITRTLNFSNKLQTIGFIISFFGVIAALCDGIENIFILTMLMEPLSFPNIWAISHSIFALIKWILLFISILWIIIAGFLNLIKRKEN